MQKGTFARQILRSLVKSIPMAGGGLEEMTFGTFDLIKQQKLEQESRLQYQHIQSQLTQISESLGRSSLADLEIAKLRLVNLSGYVRLHQLLVKPLEGKAGTDGSTIGDTVARELSAWLSTLVTSLEYAAETEIGWDDLIELQPFEEGYEIAVQDYCRRIAESLAPDPVLSQWYEVANCPDCGSSHSGQVRLDPPEGDPLWSYVQDWLSDRSRAFILLLGGYGTGKTTFCRWLTLQCAASYNMPHPHKYVPIFVRLRAYREAIGAGTLLKAHCDSVGLPAHVFDQLAAEGRLLVVLDGFDEGAMFKPKGLELAQIMNITKTLGASCKVIVSSRTSYFVDREAELQLLAAAVRGANIEADELVSPAAFGVTVHLEPWTRLQVSRYLRKRLSPEDYEKFKELPFTSQLRGVASRPILLDFLCRQWREFAGRPDLAEIDIYQTFVETWLARELWRSVRAEDVVVFLEGLAMQMLIKGQQTMPYKELSAEIQWQVERNILTHLGFDHWDELVRTSTFLDRDADDNFLFTHFSFYEYFCARAIARDFPKGLFTSGKLWEFGVTELMGPFVRDLIGEENLWQQLSALQPALDEKALDFVTNCVLILSTRPGRSRADLMARMAFWIYALRALGRMDGGFRSLVIHDWRSPSTW